MTTGEVTLAVAWKDLISWIRDPKSVLGGMLMPLLLLLVFGLAFSAGEQIPVAVASYSHGPYATRMVDIIKTMRFETSPWFQVVTTDPQSALQLFNENKVLAVVIIPEDFDAKIASGERASVEVKINNMNDDYVKNYIFRVSHAVLEFNQIAEETQPALIVTETKLLTHDVPNVTYMSSGILVLALVFGGMVNTGTIVAREWERGTIKEIVLSPTGRLSIVAGKIVGGIAQTLANGLLVFLIARAVFNLSPVGESSILVVILVLTGFMFAGVGAILGVLIKETLPVAVTSLIIGIVAWILGGGIAPSQLAIARFWPIRILTSVLPPTYAFDAVEKLMFTSSVETIGLDVAVILTSSILALALGVGILNRESRVR